MTSSSHLVINHWNFSHKCISSDILLARPIWMADILYVKSPAMWALNAAWPQAAVGHNSTPVTWTTANGQHSDLGIWNCVKHRAVNRGHIIHDLFQWALISKAGYRLLLSLLLSPSVYPNTSRYMKKLSVGWNLWDNFLLRATTANHNPSVFKMIIWMYGCMYGSEVLHVKSDLQT